MKNMKLKGSSYKVYSSVFVNCYFPVNQSYDTVASKQNRYKYSIQNHRRDLPFILQINQTIKQSVEYYFIGMPIK